MNTESTLRKNWIDTAKVIAILVVVLNHSGLHIPVVNYWGGMFYVPAFFLLAGFTYKRRTEAYSAFVKRKAGRLMVPYFVTNVILVAFFAGVKLLTGALTKNDLLTSILGFFYGRNQLYANEIPVLFGKEVAAVGGSLKEQTYFMTSLNAPTWFLPALVLLLISMELLHRKANDRQAIIWLVIVIGLLLSVCYHYFVPVLLPWGLEILPILALLFEIGYLYGKSNIFAVIGEKQWYLRLLVFGLDVVVLVIAGLINGSANMSIDIFGKSIFLFLITSIASTELLMQVMYFMDECAPKVSAFVARLSKHTLTILCWHYFVLQMCMTVLALCLEKICGGLSEDIRTMISQIVSMVVAIAACVILDLFIDQLKIRRTNIKQ